MTNPRQFAAVLAISFLFAPLLAASFPNQITEIALERGCPGCSTGTILVFRGDGTATLTRTGNERFATSNQTSKAIITRKDFNQLAGLVESQHFSQMKDDYSDPALQDAAWFSISVTRDEKSKRVMAHGDSAPPSLQKIRQAIESLGTRIFPSEYLKR